MRTFLLVVAVAVAGCGASNGGGTACKANADCEPGLSCVASVAIGNGACALTGKSVCTKQCVTDAECIRSVPVCVTSCAGLKTCAK